MLQATHHWTFITRFFGLGHVELYGAKTVNAYTDFEKEIWDLKIKTLSLKKTTVTTKIFHTLSF